MMNLWVVVDLESTKAWVFWNEQAAKNKKKERTNTHKILDPFNETPHVYLRKLVFPIYERKSSK